MREKNIGRVFELLEEVTRTIYSEWEAKHDIKISEEDILSAVRSAADTLTYEEIEMDDNALSALMEEWIRDREDDIVEGRG